MAEGTARASRLRTAAALAVVLAAFGVRFHAFLSGGTLYRRDAGFFFVPWRSVLERLLRAGEWPVWNDWMSGGRAFAADPNAAVFWPLSPLVVLLGPTGLSFLNVALLLAVFFWALRRMGLSNAGAVSGTLVLLFSGVFQSLPVFMTTCAAAAPLPLAFAELPRLSGEDSRARRRALASVALVFGLSALGGEPAITLIGAAAFSALALLAAGRRRAFPGTAAALALGLGVAAVQVLPAAAEVVRSARASMRPEHGALFWSVRPARVLTLLEPRLTGDAAAGPFWGAGTFDARGPYFEDLALGVLPLLFAAAAWRDARGRAALALAAGGAFLSFGRFLPGYGFVARAFPFVRYPEKWWLLTTFALAAAAAVGVDAVFFGDREAREKARKALLRMGMGMAVVCGALLALALGAEDFLRKVLWVVGLGAGDTSGAAVAQVLRMPLFAATATLIVCAGGFFLLSSPLFTFKENLRAPVLLAGLLAVVFLADAARRVAGTCPAGSPDLYRRETPDVALVREQAGGGRFYDDGADDRATVERRAREAGGLDLLRPETGVVFGIRYLGDYDVDRLTPAAAVRWAAATAAQPWGEEKARALRAAGVSVVRTSAPGPDPAGTEEIGRTGDDRLVKIAGARPEFAILPEGDAGSVLVVERRPSRVALRVDVTAPSATLWIGRTFDPNWRARADGREIEISPSDSYRMAATLPHGLHDVTLRYENPLFFPGVAISVAALLGAAALAFAGRRA